MTPTHVIVIGAGARGRSSATQLLAVGITDVVILDKEQGKPDDWPTSLDGLLRPGREVVSSLFDDDTHSWELRTTSRETFRAAVVIAAHRELVPWIPELFGRNDFRGVSFHAAQWDPEFDPRGKRVSVIGTDATAGHYIGQLTASAASVTVFAHAPRRVVDELSLPTTRVKR